MAGPLFGITRLRRLLRRHPAFPGAARARHLRLLTSTGKGGFRAGAAATLGVIVGDQVLLWLAVAGVAALLAAYPVAFKAVQYAGAAYLAWIGLRLLLSRGDGSASPVRIEPRDYARQAFFITLLNPKAIVFYMAFFPLFIDPATHRGLPTFAAMAADHRRHHRGVLPDPVRVRQCGGRAGTRTPQRCALAGTAGRRVPDRLRPAARCETDAHDAHLLHRQSKGRGRQDHHHGQPGRRPGAGRPACAGGRPRSAGQRDDGLGHRQAQARPQHLRRAARVGQHRRGQADAVVKGGYDVLGANRELAGAEVELVALERRNERLRDALAAVDGRLRLRADRLSAQPEPAHAERPVQRAWRDRADAVRVLRARGPDATWSTRSSRCTPI